MSISQLSIHMQTKCGTEKTFICNVCGKAFLTNANLIQHSVIHSEKNKYLCDFCGKGFALKGELKVHERSHTKEKPFTCQVCQKGFVYRESLVTHSTIHTGRPYLCSCCGRTFSCIGNLLKHKRRKPDTCGSEAHMDVKMVAPRSSTRSKERINKKRKLVRNKVKSEPAEEPSVEYLELGYDYEGIEPEQEGNEIVFEVQLVNEGENDTESTSFECFEVSLADNDSIETKNELVDEESTYETEPEQMIMEIEIEKKEEDELLSYEAQSDAEVDPIELEQDLPPLNVEEYFTFTNTCFFCQKCPKSFSTFSRCVRHLRCDHGVDKQVDAQLKSYVLKNLKQEPEETKVIVVEREGRSETKKSYPCSVCGRVFSNKTLVRDHERSMCSTNPLYKCETCGKAYQSAGSLVSP